MKHVKLFALSSLVLLATVGLSTAQAKTVYNSHEIPIDYHLINPNGVIERLGNQLVFTWQNMPKDGTVTIHWQDSLEQIQHSLKANIVKGQITLTDPNPERRTFFYLPTTKGQTITLAERKVPAEGMDNLRDLGGFKTEDGHTTRWGLAYRSDTLYKAKPAGYRYIDQMNMGYVFDLRNDLEVPKKPDPSFNGVHYFHTQIPDQPAGYEDVSWETNESTFAFVSTPRAEKFYIDTNIFMVDAPKSLDSMRTIFDAALNADGKALVWHCAGGKDRTGYVSAVFLSALGVPDETIMNEYLLTNVYREEFDRQELAEVSKAFNHHEAAVKGFLAIQQSRPEYIMAGLNQIKKEYGSMDNYLQKAIGLSKQQIQQLRQLYTE